MHPVLAAALGETDDVVVQYPVAAGSRLDGAAVGGAQLGDDTGFHLLAIRRSGRYLYRPRGRITVQAGDEVLASGPRDGRAALAEQCGYELPHDGEGEAY
jgi:uncharacterized protein with PhoU and TrkA domain